MLKIIQLQTRTGPQAQILCPWRSPFSILTLREHLCLSSASFQTQQEVSAVAIVLPGKMITPKICLSHLRPRTGYSGGSEICLSHLHPRRDIVGGGGGGIIYFSIPVTLSCFSEFSVIPNVYQMSHDISIFPVPYF